jgi:hypothetical protein
VTEDPMFQICHTKEEAVIFHAVVVYGCLKQVVLAFAGDKSVGRISLPVIL